GVEFLIPGCGVRPSYTSPLFQGRPYAARNGRVARSAGDWGGIGLGCGERGGLEQVQACGRDDAENESGHRSDRSTRRAEGGRGADLRGRSQPERGGAGRAAFDGKELALVQTSAASSPL